MNNIIFKEKGFFWFETKEGKLYKFDSEQAAVDSGGKVEVKVEEVKVSGVPYKVASVDINLTDSE